MVKGEDSRELNGPKSAGRSRSANSRERSVPGRSLAGLSALRHPRRGLRHAKIAGAPVRTVVPGLRERAEGGTADYQIWARSLSGRTIGSPGLQPKA